ncbi:MAG: ATP-grasp domain-containing protein, partial [Hydrogenobacter sp.]
MRIGILGGGQLGWMTILEGRKLGFEFFVLDKDSKSPACKVADSCFTPEQVETFLKSCDVITYEFEHIEQDLVEKVSHLLSPSAEVLRLKSSRLREKSFYRKMEYPTTEFTFAKGEELYKRLAEFGLPAVVKAEKLGYDGKGQYLVKSLLQVDEIFKNHPKDENFLVERFVSFLFEFSLIGVRSKRGDIKVYPMTIN